MSDSSHPRPTTRRAIVVGALVAATAPAFAQEALPQRLLFIGNSLTYTNNLPPDCRSRFRRRWRNGQY